MGTGIILMLIAIIVFAAVIGWAALWINTYTPSKISGYILHTSVFTALSALITWFAAKIIFSSVDETYSASNVGALGLLFIMWELVFSAACLIAIFQTLGRLLTKHCEEKQNKSEKSDISG